MTGRTNAVLGGGGTSIEVEELSVTSNGTYTAPEGKAYSPVTVNVVSFEDLVKNIVNGTGGTRQNPIEYNLSGFLEITKIPDNKFYGMQYISVVLPNSVKSIGSGAFRCNSVRTGCQSINLSNVTSIGGSAFYCGGMTTIDLSSIETVSGGAFTSCLNLETVNIGAGATSIGADAFKNCSLLSDVTVEEGFNTNLSLAWCDLSQSVLEKIVTNYENNSGKTLQVTQNTLNMADTTVMTGQSVTILAFANAKGLTIGV